MRQALAQRDIAQDGYEQQKRALDRNTRNAYQAVVAGISEVEARRLAVVSAQSAYDASQVGLEVGTRTVLDVVQNQRTLFQAKLDYAQAATPSCSAGCSASRPSARWTWPRCRTSTACCPGCRGAAGAGQHAVSHAAALAWMRERAPARLSRPIDHRP